MKPACRYGKHQLVYMSLAARKTASLPRRKMGDADYIQDHMPHNKCFGCGPANPDGLRIKSYWAGDETVCLWKPRPFHKAGPDHLLNGGIICTVIDCHSICTAIADAYRREGRSMDSDPLIWYVTASLSVSYASPVRIDVPLELRASVRSVEGRKTVVGCVLVQDGEVRCKGEVLAVRVSPESWFALSGSHGS